MIKEDIVCLVKYYSQNNVNTLRHTSIGSLILTAERISQESMNNSYSKLKRIARPFYSDKVREVTGMQVYLPREQDKFKDVSITIEFNGENPSMLQIGSIDALVLGKIASSLEL